MTLFTNVMAVLDCIFFLGWCGVRKYRERRDEEVEMESRGRSRESRWDTMSIESLRRRPRAPDIEEGYGRHGAGNFGPLEKPFGTTSVHESEYAAPTSMPSSSAHPTDQGQVTTICESRDLIGVVDVAPLALPSFAGTPVTHDRQEQMPGAQERLLSPAQVSELAMKILNMSRTGSALAEDFPSPARMLKVGLDTYNINKENEHFLSPAQIWRVALHEYNINMQKSAASEFFVSPEQILKEALRTSGCSTKVSAGNGDGLTSSSSPPSLVSDAPSLGNKQGQAAVDDHEDFMSPKQLFKVVKERYRTKRRHSPKDLVTPPVLLWTGYQDRNALRQRTSAKGDDAHTDPVDRQDPALAGQDVVEPSHQSHLLADEDIPFVPLEEMGESAQPSPTVASDKSYGFSKPPHPKRSTKTSDRDDDEQKAYIPKLPPAKLTSYAKPVVKSTVSSLYESWERTKSRLDATKDDQGPKGRRQEMYWPDKKHPCKTVELEFPAESLQAPKGIEVRLAESPPSMASRELVQVTEPEAESGASDRPGELEKGNDKSPCEDSGTSETVAAERQSANAPRHDSDDARIWVPSPSVPRSEKIWTLPGAAARLGRAIDCSWEWLPEIYELSSLLADTTISENNPALPELAEDVLRTAKRFWFHIRRGNPGAKGRGETTHIVHRFENWAFGNIKITDAIMDQMTGDERISKSVLDKSQWELDNWARDLVERGLLLILNMESFESDAESPSRDGLQMIAEAPMVEEEAADDASSLDTSESPVFVDLSGT